MPKLGGKQMTPNKEDYLKVIYKLSESDKLVTNKKIAEYLQIAPASVTEMLIKLNRDGYIIYQPYKGSVLTEQGNKIAISLLRGHRLWEVFLMKYLDYSYSEAHEDAELLEHVTPIRLIERLDQFLEHPSHCPHGSIIPKADESEVIRDNGVSNDSDESML